MFPRLVSPLTVLVVLAGSAVANASNPNSTPNIFSHPQCAPVDSMQASAIGGVASAALIRRIAVTRGNPHAPIAPHGNLAALKMMAGPVPDGTSSTCYPSLSLATSSVPAATAGASYSVSLTANGGQPPYQWSFGQSSLPSGLSLDSNGELTGTPSSAGTFAFNVVVVDSLKNAVTGELTLTVNPAATQPPPTQTTQPPPTQTTQPPPTQTTQPPPTQTTQPPPTQTTQPPPTQTTQPPPTQTTQPPPTQTPTGTALTACQDITKSGTYYLANDVSSAGTCFGIDANNITLNLNGHTVTYGTGGGSTPTPGIEGHDSWWNGSPNYTGNSYSGSAHSGLEVYGGTIVQSSNAAPFSSVFVFGEGTFTSAPYIHDVTATFQNQGAEFYYSSYLPPGAKIENNTIYDNVTNIQFPGQNYLSARSAFQGQAIYIAGQENNAVTSGDTISGNKIVGSPQGGIRTVDQYSTITNNDISQNALYSNDWCVEISADHTTATGNNCHPTSGRGINVDASYVTVQNNTLTVTELPQNAEYGGCELGGSYGVRVEHMPVGASQAGALTNDTISGNNIQVTANACNAMGFDFVYMPANSSGINVTGNNITTTNAGKSGVMDAGFQFDDSFGNGISITGNTVSSGSEWMYGDWDGFSAITVGHNTWNGSPQWTFYSGDGGCDPTNGYPNNVSSPSSCPAGVTVTDALPNKVYCGSYSEATVTINGQVTQCKATN